MLLLNGCKISHAVLIAMHQSVQVCQHFPVILLDLLIYCVVPENIHTPTTEGIGNSEGEGGSKTQEIPEARGVI